MVGWRILLLALFAGLVFAGCLGEVEEKALPTVGAGSGSAPLPAAPRPAPTATTGSLVGLVADAAYAPIPAAFVYVSADGPQRAARTDDDGRFTVNDLAPGRWTVQVTAFGYATSYVLSEIVAGEVTTETLLLAEDAAVEPYSKRSEMRGFMAYGVATYDGEIAATPDLGDPNHDTQHDFAVSPDGLETILVEIYWDDPRAGLEVDVWKNVTCNPCRAEYEYANAAGFGSITVRLDRTGDGWQGMKLDEETIWLLVWPTSDDAHPATVVYQLPYDVYVEAFYRAPAPLGYSVRGDH